MSEYYEDMTAFWDEGRRHRQELGRQRLEGFKNRFQDAKIIKETPYSIRVIIDNHLYDFFPQKCRLFVIRTGKWMNINRKGYLEHLTRIFNEQRERDGRQGL